MRVLALGACALLAACANPAGEFRNRVTYGLATDANLAAQGIRFGEAQRLADLQAAFAAAAPDRVTFAFNRSGLDAAARAALALQAAWLVENPDVRVRIVGHTDLVGSDGYNDRLGLRRARAVARQLQRLGVKASRIDMVETRGEDEPVVATEERERRNRRAITTVAGLTHGFVGDGLDGRRAVLQFTRYRTDNVGGN